MIEKLLLEDKEKILPPWMIEKIRKKEELDRIIEGDRRRPRKSIYDIEYPDDKPEKEEESKYR